MPNYYNPKLRIIVTKEENAVAGMVPDNKGGWTPGANPTVPLSEGNLIVTEEGGEMYFDLENRRISIAPAWKELT